MPTNLRDNEIVIQRRCRDRNDILSLIVVNICYASVMQSAPVVNESVFSGPL